jgi:MFS family permease
MLGAAHSLNHSLFVIAPPILGLIMVGLNVSKTDIGAVTTVASFIYGIGALIGGPLGDKIGESRTIIVSLGFSGLATLLMLAAGATGMIYVYALALILMAAWASLYHPTANSLISKAFKGKVSESMGIHGVGGTLGIVATPTVAWLIGAKYGWPWAFAVYGILSIVLAVFFVLTFKTENHGDTGGSLLNALRIRELWILLIFNIAVGLFMKGIELFFPTFLTENRSIDPMWASVAYTLLLACGVPAQWVGGKAADIFGSKKVLMITMTGVCLSLLSLLFFPIYSVGIGLFVVLYGFSFYAHQPALNSLTGFCCPPNQRGAVYGVFFFTSFGVGSISQVISGYLGDLYGLNVAFYLLTVFAAIALILSFWLPKKRES